MDYTALCPGRDCYLIKLYQFTDLQEIHCCFNWSITQNGFGTGSQHHPEFMNGDTH
jgi:hypothetical protein